MRAVRKYRRSVMLTLVLVALGAAVCRGVVSSQIVSGNSPGYFVIQVVDMQTGRGVPLVELRTTNNVRYYTDSGGIVVFREPGLMDEEVFFHVSSHGYRYPVDGFGYRGVRLRTEAGATARIEIERINVAERLYRVTGQGIYRDSILAGRSVPVEEAALNGKVMGQDSVFTCLYGGRLFWMWGDTNRPSYPLGNFEMSGAFSDLPGCGGLNPDMGVNLEYIVGDDGFSRPICPLDEPGVVWLDGLMSVEGPEGGKRMVAHFARLRGLGEVLERGIVAFDDGSRTFRPVFRGEPDAAAFTNTAHAFGVRSGGSDYYYFSSPSPLAVRMRVKATWKCVTDPNRYEILAAREGQSPRASCMHLGAKSDEAVYCWMSFGELKRSGGRDVENLGEELRQERKRARIADIETGKAVSPHNGTVYYNAYRGRWIAIFVQEGGESSYLGEVWYGEADTPAGPWGYARRIVTHDGYSFYNPKQHPYFDQAGGGRVYFEGTYSCTFSRSSEYPTPRYDYNQIMYRLDLSDKRLALPVAVYRVRTGDHGTAYMLHGQIQESGLWNNVEGIPFYAFEPDRATGELAPVYAQRASSLNHQAARLTTKRPVSSAQPLFCALPTQADNPCVVGLYEYRSKESDQCIYSTRPDVHRGEWDRADEPLCCVWKPPGGILLYDGGAKPLSMH